MDGSKFWEWIDEQGFRMNAVARRMGYSPEYVSRVRYGHFRITEAFIDSAVLAFGTGVRDLFLQPMSVKTDISAAASEATP